MIKNIIATTVGAVVGVTVGNLLWDHVLRDRIGKPVVRSNTKAEATASEQVDNGDISNALSRTALELVFKNAFENTIETVDFDSKWNNGTGYFDNFDTELVKYDPVRFTDDQGRRGLAARTLDGDVVVIFDRYSPKAENAPELHKAFNVIKKGGSPNGGRCRDVEKMSWAIDVITENFTLDKKAA